MLANKMKTKTKTKIVIDIIVGLMCLALFGSKSLTMAFIAESHIEANMPTDDDFNNIIKRDLKFYFGTQGFSNIEVVFEFLRKGLTQTGIAYPKYYLWVRVFKNGKTLVEGAARIAAIEKQRIEVTDFIRKEEIQKNNQLVCDVFPKRLCQDIINKALKWTP